MITKLHSVSEYTKLLKKQGLLVSVSGNTEAMVGHISYNSMDIKDNSLFVCKGAHFSEKGQYCICQRERIRASRKFRGYSGYCK